jgi:hypothetical protein
MLKKNLDTQQQMFNKQKTQHHSIVKARFVVSEKIAKHSKSWLQAIVGARKGLME